MNPPQRGQFWKKTQKQLKTALLHAPLSASLIASLAALVCVLGGVGLYMGYNHHKIELPRETAMLERHARELNPINVQQYPDADAAHLHGRFGLEDDGTPLWSPKPSVGQMTDEQRTEAHRGYCFNTEVSKSLALDRAVPTYTSEKCNKVLYDYRDLGTASVIIIFHNEDLSVLLRSIHSVLNRTPPLLLEEIIVVDDASNMTTHPWLDEELTKYLESCPKTRLRRLTERAGLMRARMAGVEWAAGSVLVFIDSHIEATARWMEPLLAHIAKDPKACLVPLIHTIDAENFGFGPGYLSVIGFSWLLGQTHPHRTQTDFEPIPTPAMAGGLFAIRKTWFVELGGYDKEMNLYGGEEFQISFKIWMCGGSIHAVPCSRVGHVFRTAAYWKGQVYRVPAFEIQRNKLRAAEVWMDQYAVLARLGIAKLPEGVTIGNLTEELEVRKRLHCKSFDWYLDRVFPEIFVPPIGPGSRSGSLVNPDTKACVDTMSVRAPAGHVMGSYPCHFLHGTQALLMDEDGYIRVATADYQRCATYDSEYKVVIGNCGTTKWTHDETTMQMKTADGQLCLETSRKPTSDSPYSLSVATCNASAGGQCYEWHD